MKILKNQGKFGMIMVTSQAKEAVAKFMADVPRNVVCIILFLIRRPWPRQSTRLQHGAYRKLGMESA